MNSALPTWVSSVPTASIRSRSIPARDDDLARAIAADHRPAAAVGAAAGLRTTTRAFHSRVDSHSPIAATGTIALGQACQLATALAAAGPFAGSAGPAPP